MARSAYRIDWAVITRACADADVVVSDRRLPRSCQPRWFRLDAAALKQTGGVAIYLGRTPWVDSVADRDFVLETLSAAAICAIHLSRLAEEIVWHRHDLTAAFRRLKNIQYFSHACPK